MSQSPTWYDLLDVEPTATAEEIRAAWKAAIADLDPTDRRFQRLNDAAAVLLDPEARQQYDSRLGSSVQAEEGRVGRLEAHSSADSAVPGRTFAPTRRVPGWALAVLGVLAIALVAAAAYSWSRPNPKTAESDAAEALELAERAIVPVLSYDYRTLAEDEKEADSYLTDRYRSSDFDPIFATIEENAPDAQTVVTTTVVASSIVRAGDGRVEVMLLVDRPTTNKVLTDPIVYEDHVTVTMTKTDGTWLIDNLAT